MSNSRGIFNGIISLFWWLILFFWVILYSLVDFYLGTHGYSLPWLLWYQPVSNRSTTHNIWYCCKSVHFSIQSLFCGTHYSSPRTKNFGRHRECYTNLWHWFSTIYIPHRVHFSHHPHSPLPCPQCSCLPTELSATFQCSWRIHWCLHYW